MLTVIRLITTLRDTAPRTAGLALTQVGVITPYKKQEEKIRKTLEGKGLAGIEVGSVEAFQVRGGGLLRGPFRGPSWVLCGIGGGDLQGAFKGPWRPFLCKRM